LSDIISQLLVLDAAGKRVEVLIFDEILDLLYSYYGTLIRKESPASLGQL